MHSLADMIKLGMVYLDGGLCRGRRVLSEDRTSLAVSRGFTLDWDERHFTYRKGGMCGQKLIVVPGQHRVAALQSFNADSRRIVK